MWFTHGMARGLRFVWDPHKEALNRRKHGITFIEAASVFGDSASLTIPDPDHGGDEELREITIGQSGKLRLVVVSHTERSGAIRIISARKATRREAAWYQEGDYA